MPRPGADITAIWHGFSSLTDRESRRAFLATTRAVIDIGGQSISAHDHLEGNELPIPTLIVWGSKDRMIPASHALSAQGAVPDCRVELFEGWFPPPPRRPRPVRAGAPPVHRHRCHGGHPAKDDPCR